MRIALLGSRRSPFVRKIRVVLDEKNLEYELLEVEISSSNSPVFAYNPLGKVPCLVAGDIDNGESFYDSSVIVEYLDFLSPTPRMYPSGSLERVRARRIEALADGVLDAGILARSELVERADELRNPEWIWRQMKKIHSGVAALSQALSGDRYYCGNTLTIADISTSVTLAWLDFRFPEVNWSARFPNLRRLLSETGSRTSFTSSEPWAS
ncbi:glutathione S-transferase N-terminal domain-containing protein [Paraburkholderia caffeinilytica]|uniref:Glutathione S-transferase n=1 Tax=Paraburkholderia caffeinilytica TaxID=1761016 RepID=A0ABQ1LRY1_9BURK|nr:glutathione S-transferase C-terminal domain-containing protein [Paraburkholderia caffeinilytica]GGC29051.1 glutathione S-transferase [Paraburkholderia caffeinilytica]CAB3781304.1 putative GST-like protein YibF [Paraburkholderia caffeinilytica]